jgi:hypothetical protein
MTVDFNKYCAKELLQLFSELIEALRRKELIRSTNNPVADFTEYLVAKNFSYSLENNSKMGYDAIDKNVIKFQIKGRRIHSRNNSRQLSVIRNLDKKFFDYLIAVIYAEDFSILEAYQIPYDLIKPYSRFSEHQNGNILILRGNILVEKKVMKIEDKLRETYTQL